MESPSTAAANALDWSRAWTALKILIADSERTDQVFEIIDALSGRSFERGFARFVADPGGVVCTAGVHRAASVTRSLSPPACAELIRSRLYRG